MDWEKRCGGAGSLLQDLKQTERAGEGIWKPRRLVRPARGISVPIQTLQNQNWIYRQVTLLGVCVCIQSICIHTVWLHARVAASRTRWISFTSKSVEGHESVILGHEVRKFKKCPCTSGLQWVHLTGREAAPSKFHSSCCFRNNGVSLWYCRYWRSMHFHGEEKTWLKVQSRRVGIQSAKRRKPWRTSQPISISVIMLRGWELANSPCTLDCSLPNAESILVFKVKDFRWPHRHIAHAITIEGGEYSRKKQKQKRQ